MALLLESIPALFNPIPINFALWRPHHANRAISKKEQEMRSPRVANITEYLNPTSSSWKKIKVEEVSLIPTPLPMQPTEYIRKSWEGRAYGKATSMQVASVHDGHMWAIRASWKGVSPAGRDFPDALAVALPVHGKPMLALMGAPDAPIHILRWAANKEGARSMLATGIGQSQPGAEIKCNAQAKSDGDIWSVVISRAMGVGKDVAPLAAGQQTGIGFALWSGGNDERAGIKAFSIDWAKLALDA
jgi:DMSO reductase family type II enzyme heme b subunit